MKLRTSFVTLGVTACFLTALFVAPTLFGASLRRFEIKSRAAANSSAADSLVSVIRGLIGWSSSADNLPPIANGDSYTVHGPTLIGPYLSNDQNLDDPSHTVAIISQPTQGTLSGQSYDRAIYTPALGYTGPDSFQYRLCDPISQCSTATVSITAVNTAPVPLDDYYTVHGATVIGPFLANDIDVEGDTMRVDAIVAGPYHGTLGSALPEYKRWYTPALGYAGPDSFVYRVCDQYNACYTATVFLTVTNNGPIGGPDYYTARGGLLNTLGPMLKNDSDPDGDPIRFDGNLVSYPTHGTLYGYTQDDIKLYVPYNNFYGFDSFVYRVCDDKGFCSNTSVSIYVVDNDDAENIGAADCNARIGNPINVTNGNMYIQQTDVVLPGPGGGFSLTRTYNSLSSRIGLFGRGWTTMLDEWIKVYDASTIRFYLPDGRAVNFGRVNGVGSFFPLERDFHGSIAKNADSSYTLTTKEGGVHQFNSTGKLVSISDRNGNQIALGYTAGVPSSITDSAGRVLTVTSNSNGRVTAITDSSGTFATYTYGSGNELLRVAYADGSAFNFAYTASPYYWLSSVTDALGNVLESHLYWPWGAAKTSEVHGGQEKYTLNYISSPPQTSVTDGLGRVTTYFYDKTRVRNLVTRVDGACSCGGAQTTTWTYDDNLNVKTIKDALNRTTSFTYDADGNRLTATNLVGTTAFTYNAYGQVLTVTDPMNGVTTNTYDQFGQLLTTTGPTGSVTTFTYDSRGLPLTMTDPLNHATTFTWDTSGNLTRVTDALANQTNIGYDARGRMTSTTDALGNVRSVTYDLVGRVRTVTEPDGSVVTFTYDLAGRRTRVTDARGNNADFAYDGAYRLVSETNPVGGTATYAYDLMSNLTGVTDALGRTTNYTFDDFNRLTKVTHPEPTAGAGRPEERFVYDAVGNVTQRIDQLNRAASFAYDAINRLTSTTDAAGKITRFEHNARSQQTALVDALNQRYEFTYDPLGRVTQTTRGTATMNFVYDAAGNRTQRTDYNGAVTNYAFDALNRLTTITYPNATQVSYGYDALSRMTSATNQHGTVAISYDNRSRVASVTDVFGQTVGYSYDANSNRTQLQVGGAAYTNYQYDALNRLTQLTDAAGLAFAFNYDATSKLTSRTAPNGVVSSFQYDALNRLTRLTHAIGTPPNQTTLSDFQYQFNAVNNITQVAELAGAHSYGYDLVNRLTAATHVTSPAQPNESYSFNDVGNRTASQQGASYSYQTFNRLTGANGTTFGYDANGNLLSKTDAGGSWVYTWDYENRLTQVTRPDGVSITHKYDALGRRIERARSTGEWTRFVYDGADVVKDINNDGTTVEYLNGPGIDNKLRQSSADTGHLYFIHDHLGSTRSLTNGSGAVVADWSYDSFGNVTGVSNPALTRYTYTGREADPDTGLMYYRARWYDPQQGRFISEDPIGFAGGINQFRYAGNDAMNAKDPLGLYEIDVHYYLTYFLALKNGCFSPAEARDIAEGDQGADEDDDTKPGLGSTPKQREQNRRNHALHAGAAEGVGSQQLLGEAMSGSGDPRAFGRYLHYLQDTFSHAGYTSAVYGHAFDGHYWDKTSSDFERANRMAAATWRALNEFSKAKKCGCQGTWDRSWWVQVLNFNAASGGEWSSVATIDAKGEVDTGYKTTDPRFLETKTGLLGLSPR